MMLLATFLTSHFGEWRQSWHGMPRRAQVGSDPAADVSEANEGILAAIDFDSGKVLHSVTLNTPAGFAVGGDCIYVASMYANRILQLRRDFGVADSFATRLMNDLHGVVAVGNGLLVASSGTDSIIEIDYSGAQKWSWLATEHGYRDSPSGHRVRVRRDHDYRSSQISTIAQATHCNSVFPCRLDGREVVLVTLFHQGQLISVEKESGRSSVLVRGMRNPHSIRKANGGWIVSDSRSNAVIMLSEDFWIDAIIESDFNWVQDAIALDDGILIADANNSRIVLWDLKGGRISHQVSYPEEWKIYQVEVAPARWEEAVQSSAEAFSHVEPRSPDSSRSRL